MAISLGIYPIFRPHILWYDGGWCSPFQTTSHGAVHRPWLRPAYQTAWWSLTVGWNQICLQRRCGEGDSEICMSSTEVLSLELVRSNVIWCDMLYTIFQWTHPECYFFFLPRTLSITPSWLRHDSFETPTTKGSWVLPHVNRAWPSFKTMTN